MYQIGQKIFFQGIEITITTAPSAIYGGEFQDGVDENGKAYSVISPEQQEASCQTKQTEWENRQASFRRLKELQS